MRTLILLIISLFIFSACNSDEIVNSGTVSIPVDTSTFVYPFTIGSTWSYTRTYSAENIRPDSIRHYFNYLPVHGSGTITISHDTLINGISTRSFRDTYTEYTHTDTFTNNNINYFANYDSGLVVYAYRNDGGGAGFPYRPNSPLRFQMNGKIFNSMQDALSYVENGTVFPGDDTLMIENPPAMVMKYPVVKNTEWFFKDITGLSRITKKYLSFEIILINGNPITCVKTRRIWSDFPNDLVLYDYISKYGQVRRDYTVKNMIITNEFGVTLGYADMRDVYQVTSFNIVAP